MEEEVFRRLDYLRKEWLLRVVEEVGAEVEEDWWTIPLELFYLQ